jgi:large subunit ribosomal protein L6
MSRVGKQPIPLPEEVSVKIGRNNQVTVKGPKGEISQLLHADMKISKKGGEIIVTRPSDSGLHRAMHGLTRTLIANMVLGVTQGFQKNLEIHGVGYRALKQGDSIVLQVGYSHTVEVAPPPGIELLVEGNNRISVQGIDKQQVGEVAAQIRRVRKPEPYKGKGIRYAGEYVRRKAGKAGRVVGR